MKFRPGDIPAGDPDPGSEVQWVDNWLSNTFAWASYKFVPGWCQSPEHWTAKVTTYLFTDCPCCLLFRGIVVGVVVGSSIILLFAIAIALWFLLKG